MRVGVTGLKTPDTSIATEKCCETVGLQRGSVVAGAEAGSDDTTRDIE
eukprot:CAMPEP_0175946820 /NCGR_PEP_ID=MMETSP0108-20121206/27542_1 /TAXON_ID=195067 ORGANISM="Goniomonas pacifica, Strain CCMP1869" /NCGR_SAMPLE_ID=MMETSP0108 /ASSEMBLY_ACC=CAM_ASM_000204 /LENGTH=47 /DNA_ID= /DNA_START= /DNA_END= /DNA_ORIENTATION=